MKTYKVQFCDTVYIDAENESDAVDQAMSQMQELVLTEVEQYECVEVDAVNGKYVMKFD